jgi:hypothetical protein
MLSVGTPAKPYMSSKKGRHDTQQNVIQHNHVQYYNKQNTTLSILTLRVMADNVMLGVPYAVCYILSPLY